MWSDHLLVFSIGILMVPLVDAFTLLPTRKGHNNKNHHSCTLQRQQPLHYHQQEERQQHRQTAWVLKMASTETAADPLGLTPELRSMTNAFALAPDDALRHKQLLFMADQLPAVPPEIYVDSNKVPGCLSTVHIDATTTWDDEIDNFRINFVGDSDGLLTKGLVALLIRGLSGATAKQIAAVNPSFIQEAGIGQSLTPGRNNGFLNMLNVMKKKAVAVDNLANMEKIAAAKKAAEEAAAAAAAAKAEEERAALEAAKGVEGADDCPDPRGYAEDHPIYNQIIKTIRREWNCLRLILRDTTEAHRLMADLLGYTKEAYFDLTIISHDFDEWNVFERQKNVYKSLKHIMPKLERLSLRLNTVEEVAWDKELEYIVQEPLPYRNATLGAEIDAKEAKEAEERAAERAKEEAEEAAAVEEEDDED